MAHQRTALLAWGLALAACAAAAPFTLVANVVSHSLVHAGGVVHPQPQVDVQCPEHPGLRCSWHVSGHQVLVNVFHDPPTIVNSWTGGGVEVVHKKTTDKSGQEDEGSRREPFEEDDAPNVVSNWNPGKPDRVLRKNDPYGNDEDFGTPETTTVSEGSNEHPSDEDNFIPHGEEERNSFSTEDSDMTSQKPEDNHDSEEVPSIHETNEDYESYLRSNDETTHSLDTAFGSTETEQRYGDSNEENTNNNNDDNHSGIENTTPDIVSDENEETDESNQEDNEEDNEEERSQENSQYIVTTTESFLAGEWWPAW